MRRQLPERLVKAHHVDAAEFMHLMTRGRVWCHSSSRSRRTASLAGFFVLSHALLGPLRFAKLSRCAWLPRQTGGLMNKLSVVLIGAAMALAHGAQAAELRVLAGGAMTAVWAEVKPKFEQASGHKLDIFFGTTPNLIKEATSGKPFDVGIVPVEVTQNAAARVKFAAGPTLDVARVGLGVAVRAGAAKPDISTPETLKATLLKAQSVASIPASATGYSIAKVFDRLGITEAMKAKMYVRSLRTPSYYPNYYYCPY
jgi:hypothetical protein